MFSKFRYIIFESIRGFLYARTPAMLSSITIGISLIIISLSFYSYIIFINYSDSFTDDYKLEIFFDNNLSYEDSYKIYLEIDDYSGISAGEFIDKETSSIKFKEFFDEDIETLLGENPLPYSGEFILNDSHRFPDSLIVISKKLNEIKGLESVQYDKEILVRIYSIINKIMTAFSVIGVCIVILSIVLVSNTTKITIYSKRENINILSLLGATNLFIRVPFLIEGFMQGLIGGLISIFLLFSLKQLIEYIFSPFVILYDNNIHFLVIINIILGAVFGLIGSKRAVRKYLP